MTSLAVSRSFAGSQRLDYLTETEQELRRILKTARRPVFLCSFGKESMAVLHMLQQYSSRVAIAYFEFGIEPKKHHFAKSQIATLGKQVLALRPHRTEVIRGANNASVAYEFDLACGKRFAPFSMSPSSFSLARIGFGRSL